MKLFSAVKFAMGYENNNISFLVIHKSKFLQKNVEKTRTGSSNKESFRSFCRGWYFIAFPKV